VIREQDRLGLISELQIDAGEVADLYEQLLEAEQLHDHATMGRLLADAVLLPSWDDSWIVAERERLRLIRVHTLESAAIRLASHRPNVALLAARAAIRTEPLLESAWRIVVRVNLEQGNVAAAHTAYQKYRVMLADELGVSPSELMEALVRRH
jgi:DNA-binding SARP family transcriptional activator